MKKMLLIVKMAVALVAAAAASGASSSDPSAAGPVRVRSASRSLPMLAAMSNGFFADEGLQVDYAQFVSSKPTFIQVDQQAIEFVISSMDNAINYQLNPGNPAGRILDNVIVAGHDLGLGLALTAALPYPNSESLRGQRVGVDVPHSGFGLPAEKILLDRGLVADVDYTLLSAGSTPARYEGLLHGSWEAAIINAEGVARAQDAGLPVIGTVADLFDAYQGGILAGNREWLAAHPETAVGFLRSYVRAIAWVTDPRNSNAAISLLIDNATAVPLATRIYNLNVDRNGLAPFGELNLSGFRTVLELRDEFHGFEAIQDIDRLTSPAGGLYNLSYYGRAVCTLSLGLTCDPRLI